MTPAERKAFKIALTKLLSRAGIYDVHPHISEIIYIQDDTQFLVKVIDPEDGGARYHGPRYFQVTVKETM